MENFQFVRKTMSRFLSIFQAYGSLWSHVIISLS